MIPAELALRPVGTVAALTSALIDIELELLGKPPPEREATIGEEMAEGATERAGATNGNPRNSDS